MTHHAPTEESTTRNNSDLTAIQHVLGGNRTAFEALYTKYVKRIYTMVRRMVSVPLEAEEVTQEAFYQVYRALPSFQGNSQFYTWMYRIATNVALQHVKKQIRMRRNVPFDDTHASEALAQRTEAGDPQKVSETRALFTAIEHRIETLPINQRVVMILGPIQGHSYDEMAQIIGTTTEVVKARLHRARENLREDLARLRGPACDTP